jgi:hypothetical protein
MLDCTNKADSLDYGTLLRPPPGYRLERAVGTTYSLDLVALLAIPVALFRHSDPGEGVGLDKPDLIDAIQDMAEKVTIYCQKGKLTTSRPPGKALCFIEECVREVMPLDARTSFHPKLWILSFTQEGGPGLFRLVVASRNLTFDRSWDVAYYLEGVVGAKAQDANAPLVDMLRWLTDQSAFPGHDRFIDQLGRAYLKPGGPFKRATFHPSGFDDRRSPLLEERFSDLLVVSPFVDRMALRALATRSTGKRWLLSRREELDRMPLEDLKPYETWTFSEAIEQGESFEANAEEGGEPPKPQQLHAKLYIGDRDGDDTQWYLGSANCSQAALERNGEFLIGLNTQVSNLTAASMARSLLERDDKRRVFEPYVRSTEAPLRAAEHDHRPAVHALLTWLEANGLSAELMPHATEPGVFELELTTDGSMPEIEGLSLRCAPLGYRGEPAALARNSTYTFAPMALFDLSPFLTWRLEQAGQEPLEFLTLLHIELPAGRKDAVFRSLFKDGESFLRFIQFLLGDEDVDLFATEEVKPGARTGELFGYSKLGSFPLLEQLLVAASRHPDRLVAIDKAIRRLERVDGGDVIPAEFLSIWPRFRSFMHG